MSNKDNASSKQDATSQNNISELGNVDQIREILFGSQTRELNKRFEKIENDIKRSSEEIFVKMEQNQKELTSRLDSEFEMLNKKIKNITTQQQKELSDMRDSEVKQEKRIQTSIEMLTDEFHTKNEQLYKEQLENKNSLHSDIANLKKELFQILDEKFLEYENKKLSRDDAAEIMMETAMKLKGTQIEQQLVSVQSKK